MTCQMLLPRRIVVSSLNLIISVRRIGVINATWEEANQIADAPFAMDLCVTCAANGLDTREYDFLEVLNEPWFAYREIFSSNAHTRERWTQRIAGEDVQLLYGSGGHTIARPGKLFNSCARLRGRAGDWHSQDLRST